MGRNYNPQGSQDRSEKDCCGCRKFSWMLYILVLLSLALAILNFWMSLSTHEDIRLEMMDLKSELVTLSSRLNLTKEELGRSELENNRFHRNMDDEMVNIKHEIESLRTHVRQNLRHDQHQHNSGDFEEIKQLKIMHKKFEEKIENLNAQLIGFEITNNNNLNEIEKSRRSIDGLIEKVSQNKRDIDDIVSYQTKNKTHKSLEGEMIRSPDFYEWNETVQDLKDSVVQLIEKVDLNAEETKSIQKLVEQLERFDESSSRLSRAEQRLLDLEGNEMQIKSDIRRLNQTAMFKLQEDEEDEDTQLARNIDDDQDHAERSLAYLEDLGDVKLRVSNLELNCKSLSEGLSLNLTSMSDKIWDKVTSLEDQISANRKFSDQLEDSLNKINGKIKFLGKNLKASTK